MTKKRSRYVGFDWKSLETGGNLAAESVKGIFGMTHHVDAKFAERFYDPTTARAMKAKAAAARGASGSAAELETIEGFLNRHFKA